MDWKKKLRTAKNFGTPWWTKDHNGTFVHGSDGFRWGFHWVTKTCQCFHMVSASQQHPKGQTDRGWPEVKWMPHSRHKYLRLLVTKTNICGTDLMNLHSISVITSVNGFKWQPLTFVMECVLGIPQGNSQIPHRRKSIDSMIKRWQGCRYLGETTATHLQYWNGITKKTNKSCHPWVHILYTLSILECFQCCIPSTLEKEGWKTILVRKLGPYSEVAWGRTNLEIEPKGPSKANR